MARRRLLAALSLLGFVTASCAGDGSASSGSATTAVVGTAAAITSTASPAVATTAPADTTTAPALASPAFTTRPPVATPVVITATEGSKWDARSYTAPSSNGQIVVTGRNKSGISHNLFLIAADGRQVPQHEDLPKGGTDKTESFDVTLGTYTVICKIPGHFNMKATLLVT